jgi:signal peptidase II
LIGPTAVRGRWLLFVGLAAAVVVADQASKAWVRASLVYGDRPTPVIGDLVRLLYSQNRGGIFGLFGDSATLLGLASLGVIGLIVLYMAREGVRSHWLLTVALGLLLGGAIGNLIDRLSLGFVIDWVDMGIGTWRWYTFNVADAAISTSLLLFVLIGLFGERIAARLQDRPAH